MRLGVGDTLSVRLPAVPSTGRVWRVAVNDPQVLRSAGAPRLEPVASDLVGSSGSQVFEFQAARAGKSNLGLVSGNPSDPAAAPESLFPLAIVIEQVLAPPGVVSLGSPTTARSSTSSRAT